MGRVIASDWKRWQPADELSGKSEGSGALIVEASTSILEMNWKSNIAIRPVPMHRFLSRYHKRNKNLKDN